MRKMLFENYLLRYAQELTGSASTSLKKLLDLSLNGYSRAFEPIFLLFVLKGRGESAWELLKKTPYKDSTQYILSKSPDESALMQLLAEENDDNASLLRYRRVFQAYQNTLNKLSVDREASLIMRDKMLPLMKKKGLSNYRVYTDLGLNPGNVNSFLKNGDASRVSRETARKMLSFVQSA